MLIATLRKLFTIYPSLPEYVVINTWHMHRYTQIREWVHAICRSKLILVCFYLYVHIRCGAVFGFVKRLQIVFCYFCCCFARNEWNSQFNRCVMLDKTDNINQSQSHVIFIRSHTNTEHAHTRRYEWENRLTAVELISLFLGKPQCQITLEANSEICTNKCMFAATYTLHATSHTHMNLTTSIVFSFSESIG